MCFMCVDDVEWELLDWGSIGWVVRPNNVPDGIDAVRARREAARRGRVTTSTPTRTRRRSSSCAAEASSSGSTESARSSPSGTSR